MDIRVSFSIEDFEPYIVIDCLDEMELLIDTGLGIIIPNEKEELCLCEA